MLWNNLTIKVMDGTIDLLEIKKEGKKKMMIKEYLNGEKEQYEGMICNEEN